MKKEKHIAVTGSAGKSIILRILQHMYLEDKKNVSGSFGKDGHFKNGKFIRHRKNSQDHLLKDNDTEILLSEASSKQLASINAYEIESIDCAIFSSFDETEHMEIHKTKEKYIEDKIRILSFFKNDGVFILNDKVKTSIDFHKLIKNKTIITYGFDTDSDYVISDLNQNVLGSVFKLTYKDNSYTIKTSLWSKANISNLTAALIAYSKCSGTDLNSTIKKAAAFPGVKGRFNIFKISDLNSDIIIDYAHTPIGFENILKTAKEISNKKIVCVFGCGGNKSIEKRRILGKIAEKYSNSIIITNDNPRNESPHKIANDITSGIEDKNKYEIILDRNLAVTYAINENRNSTIIILGKGNESINTIGPIDIPYSDHNTILTYVINNQYTMMKAYEYID